MTDAGLIQFHADSLRKFARCWHSAEAAAAEGVAAPEAAYHLLEDAGLLYRYTADDRWLAPFVRQAPADRKRLITAACAFVGGLALAEQARPLLAAEELGPGQWDAVEALLARRDALEVVLDLAKRLAADLLDPPDAEVLQGLAGACCVAAAFDDELLARPDVAALASRALLGLRDQLRTPPDPRQYWWFGLAQEADEAAENDTVAGWLGLRPAPTGGDSGREPTAAELLEETCQLLSETGFSATHGCFGRGPHVTVSLRPEPGNRQGTFTLRVRCRAGGAHAVPWEGVPVFVQPTRGDRVELVALAYLDAQGDADITDLIPGNYALVASPVWGRSAGALPLSRKSAWDRVCTSEDDRVEVMVGRDRRGRLLVGAATEAPELAGARLAYLFVRPGTTAVRHKELAGVVRVRLTQQETAPALPPEAGWEAREPQAALAAASAEEGQLLFVALPPEA
jgi:hypothetical protein